MIQQSLLSEVIEQQRQKMLALDLGLMRESLIDLPDIRSHVLIISGVRRCGKSTLLKQFLQHQHQEVLFLNFEDPRLYDFERTDFLILDKLISESGKEVLFFDEIQVVEGWELYVRQKLDEGFKVVATGSNASMLSRELGTKLTGRHITKELFPFSYREILSFKSLQPDVDSLGEYLSEGGFPEYVKTSNTDILNMLLDDILNRDIAVRYHIRDIRSLKRLCIYLMSNVGNLVSASRLRRVLSIKTTNTILEYFSFLESAYLVSFLPKFSYSLKVQMVNPRKVYVIDPGIIKIASASFARDNGRLLENFVYWHLRRMNHDLFYFNENGNECDFVVVKNERILQVIQVCYELNLENRSREQNGLKAAMDFFRTDSGIIVTFNQKDTYIQDGRKIKVIPAYQFALE